MNLATTHAGFVAILGRPNVGKSTLLNKILGKKISITSRKPQTTRNKIVGIKTSENFQAIYVDSPGLHNKNDKLLNRYMNKAALSLLNDVDVIIFVVAGTMWHREDEVVLQFLSQVKCPVILVINKIDLLRQKQELFQHIKNVQHKYPFSAVVAISAEDGTNISLLEQEVQKLLPHNPFFYPPEQITDQNNKSLIAEIIREKLTRFLGQELPYAVLVVVDQIKAEEKIVHIVVTIYVERSGQKTIIIGKGGERLKKIGILARQDIEKLLLKQVFLRLWVKVKSNWTDDKLFLQQLGYE